MNAQALGFYEESHNGHPSIAAQDAVKSLVSTRSAIVLKATFWPCSPCSAKRKSS
jgi:hypothetical protein